MFELHVVADVDVVGLATLIAALSAFIRLIIR